MLVDEIAAQGLIALGGGRFHIARYIHKFTYGEEPLLQIMLPIRVAGEQIFSHAKAFLEREVIPFTFKDNGVEAEITFQGEGVADFGNLLSDYYNGVRITATPLSSSSTLAGDILKSSFGPWRELGKERSLPAEQAIAHRLAEEQRIKELLLKHLGTTQEKAATMAKALTDIVLNRGKVQGHGP